MKKLALDYCDGNGAVAICLLKDGDAYYLADAATPPIPVRDWNARMSERVLAGEQLVLHLRDPEASSPMGALSLREQEGEFCCGWPEYECDQGPLAYKEQGGWVPVYVSMVDEEEVA